MDDLKCYFLSTLIITIGSACLIATSVNPGMHLYDIPLMILAWILILFPAFKYWYELLTKKRN